MPRPSVNTATHRRIAHYSGRVQGVGFRYTALNIARQYDVRGYVKNLPDGRVELVVEGPDQQMDEFVAAVKNAMGKYIDRVQIQEIPASGEFDRFYIES